MKKLIIALILFSGCQDTSKTYTYTHKYYEGSIVYLKLDSTRCYVIDVDVYPNCTVNYSVHYNDKLGVIHFAYLQESELY